MAPSTTGRRTNLALALLLAVTAVTGVLMFAIGTGWNEWSTVAHGVAGTAVVALLRGSRRSAGGGSHAAGGAPPSRRSRSRSPCSSRS
jgi:hypothetical protein